MQQHWHGISRILRHANRWVHKWNWAFKEWCARHWMSLTPMMQKTVFACVWLAHVHVRTFKKCNTENVFCKCFETPTEEARSHTCWKIELTCSADSLAQFCKPDESTHIKLAGTADFPISPIAAELSSLQGGTKNGEWHLDEIVWFALCPICLSLASSTTVTSNGCNEADECKDFDFKFRLTSIWWGKRLQGEAGDNANVNLTDNCGE